MLLLREEIEDAADAAGGAGGMDRAEDEMPRLGGVDRRFEGFHVPQLTDEDDVGILADRVLHPDLEVLDVGADLPLVDQALVFGEHELDRILEGEDVLAVGLVDVIEHRSDRRALAGAGDAREQHHPLVEDAHPLEARREEEPLEVGNLVVDAPRDHPQRALLVEEIDAKPPAYVVDDAGVGEVGTAVDVEDLLLPIVEHREAEPLHRLVVELVVLERLERALDPHEGGLADLQMEIASLQPHQRLEQPVDLETVLLLHPADGGDRGGLRGGFDRGHGMPVEGVRGKRGNFPVTANRPPTGTGRGTSAGGRTPSGGGRSDRDPPTDEQFLDLPNRTLAEVEDASGQGCIGPAERNRVGKVFGPAGAATGDDGNANGATDRGGDLQVVAVARPVAVHARQHDLPCPEPLDLSRPGHSLEPGRHPAPADKHLPDLPAVLHHPFGVDVDDRRTAAEPVGDA